MLSHFMIRGWRDASMSVLCVALVLGFVFPSVFSPLQAHSTLLLQVIFLISSLRINVQGVWKEFRDWKTLAWVTLWMLFCLPVLTVVIVRPIFPSLAPPLLLLAAMPVGMTTPLLAQFFRLNIALALALTLTTSLLAPFTVPIVLQLFTTGSQAIEISHLFMTLIQVIIMPLVLAQFLRLLTPNLVQSTHSWHKPISLVLVGLLLASIVGHYQAALLQHMTVEYGLGLFVLCLFFLGVHFLGYWMAWWRNEQDRLTITFSVVYMNFTLAIFIAERFFHDPTVIFYTLLSIFPWNIGMLIFQRVVRG